MLRILKTQSKILTLFVIILWIIAAIDFYLGGGLQQFGIVPRSQLGLRGIVFAPFIHANFPHLITNTVPFISLGWFVMLRSTPDFFYVTAASILIGGLGTWLVASSDTLHIGASGMIFGYIGYLLSRAYFERSLLSILVSIAIALVYGGLLWGVLPGQLGVSWEGHLFGLIGGIFAAWQIVARVNKRQKNLIG